MANFVYLFLMGQPATGGTGQSNLSFMFLMVAFFVIIYFFMIRPQMKKTKEMNLYRNSLQKGDKVVTTGGIYGRVSEVKDNYVMLEVGGDFKMKVDKNALLKDPSDVEQK